MRNAYGSWGCLGSIVVTEGGRFAGVVGDGYAEVGVSIGVVERVAEDDLPDGQEEFIRLNAELSLEWPVITEMGEPPADAVEWDGKEGKLQYLER